VAYSTEDQEVEAARNRLALADVSFIAKLMVRGTGAGDLVATLSGANLISNPGRVLPLKADPSVLICHLHIDQLLMLAGPSSKIRLDQVLTKAGKNPTLIQTDRTSSLAAFWLLGPHTDEVLRQITHHDVAAIHPGSCVETGLGGVPAILVRPPSPALLSMRVLIGWDVAEYVWEIIWQAGQSQKITPLGMDGLDVLLGPGSKM
jgi:glycine cleavage system aminomethyltransferase T